MRRALDIYLLIAFLLGLGVAQHKLNNGITSDGAHYVVPIGPAIAWAPAYLAVAAVDWMGGVSRPAAPDAGAARGLTGPYVRAVNISSFVVMAAGLFVLHLRLRREFGPSIALVT